MAFSTVDRNESQFSEDELTIKRSNLPIFPLLRSTIPLDHAEYGSTSFLTIEFILLKNCIHSERNSSALSLNKVSGYPKVLKTQVRQSITVSDDLSLVANSQVKRENKSITTSIYFLFLSVVGRGPTKSIETH